MAAGLQYNNMERISNWINGTEVEPNSKRFLSKINPDTEEVLWQFIDSDEVDVKKAVDTAYKAFESWKVTTAIQRGDYLNEFVSKMIEFREELIECNALETGKSLKDSSGEFEAAIKQGMYWVGEGMRLYSNSLTSADINKFSTTIKVPHGVCGLIVPANTALANICWKIFPALLCGNTAILKASEDAPKLALLIGRISKKSNLPNGVLNILQGSGRNSGELLINDPRVKLISFTGSTSTGKHIANVASNYLTRISLELGGKNPFMVCNDANIDLSIHWAILSAFSNAGQRCAAASRIIVMDKIYDEFKQKFIDKARNLTLGIDSTSDLGPVINARQKESILNNINYAISQGGKLLTGQDNFKNKRKGYYVYPTIIEDIKEQNFLVDTEIFGPVAILQKARNFEHLINLGNSSKYGLTAAIHTKDINMAMSAAKLIQAGTFNINFGTFGSEAHMPFGGLGESGNGTREPGVEAINVYTELKNVSIKIDDKLAHEE